MILLDTHIWHWWINQIPRKLSVQTCHLIEEAEQVAISVMSCFEMAWLVRHKRILLPVSFDDWFKQIEQEKLFEFLPVTPVIAMQAVALPEYHRDPIDRLIISTALAYNAKLISFDSIFPQYQSIGLDLISENLS